MEPTCKEGTDQGLISSSTDSHKSSNQPKNNRRRVDFRLTLHGHKFRLQAYEDTQEGQLLLWLKGLPKRERDGKIMEAMLAFYYPAALAWLREHDEEFKDVKDEDIQKATWLSLNQIIAQMESIEFLLIHEENHLDHKQEIKDWETARALVKARLGEHRYNYLTNNSDPNGSSVN